MFSNDSDVAKSSGHSNNNTIMPVWRHSLYHHSFNAVLDVSFFKNVEWKDFAMVVTGKENIRNYRLIMKVMKQAVARCTRQHFLFKELHKN